MQVTIDDAIKCLALFRDKVPENGFVSSCLDLSISALKTVQDGNYKIQEADKYQKEIGLIASYECFDVCCEDCPLHAKGEHMAYACASTQARRVVQGHNDLRKELEQWIQENFSKISQKL